MNWSRYNFISQKDDHTYILYNYVDDSIIFLCKELLEIVNKNIQHVDTLAAIHPDLYGELSNKGFIINDNIDEEDFVMKKITDKLNASTTFKLIINPTLNCNLRCWYCYESHIVDSYMNDETKNAVIKLVSKKLSDPRVEVMDLSFFGGEPLLRAQKIALPLIYKIKEICDSYNKKFRVHFTSNAVLLNTSIIEALSAVTQDISFQIPFDGGKTKHNEVKKTGNAQGTYDKILVNVLNALKKGFKVNIRCNYNLANIDSFEELILDIDRLASDYKKQITVSLQKIWQTSYSETLKDKTERIKQLIKEKEFHCNLIGKGTISTYCYADYDNTLVVNYNGDIFKCTARDFKSELRDGVLTANGTICFTNNYKKRINSRFNTDCKNCPILPICTICSQKKIESRHISGCPLNIPLEDKKQQIQYRLKALCSEYS